MPYIITKTNGKTLTTVEDASLDKTTELSLVGRNYSGYGQVFNENFIKLLENFSNTTAPKKPVQGQLWFDSSTNRLKFTYDGKNFKNIANMFVKSSAPTSSELVQGDLFWDTTKSQLKVWDGSVFSVIGPISAATSKAYWVPDTIDTTYYEDTPILKAELDNQTISVISYRSFNPVDPSDLYLNGFSHVRPGVSLPGADTDGKTSHSTSTGYLFWGTAAHSLKVEATETTSEETLYVPLVGSTTGAQSIVTTSSVTVTDGTLAAPVMQTGSYANTATITASIPSPVAGMIVFNSGRTKFQGYNGTTWVDLH